MASSDLSENSQRLGTHHHSPHADVRIPSWDLEALGLSTEAQSSSSPHFDPHRRLLTQVASLHRAAEVARWHWVKAHEVQLRQAATTRTSRGRSSSRTASSASRYEPPASSAGSSRSLLQDSSTDDDAGQSASSGDRLPRPSGRRPSHSSQTSALQAGGRDPEGGRLASERLHPSGLFLARRTPPHPTPQESRPTLAVVRGLNTWNRLCRDLAHASGVIDDAGHDSDGDSYNGDACPAVAAVDDSEDRSYYPPPPPFLFGYTSGTRSLPAPSWSNRYTGAAGVWLSRELSIRGIDWSISNPSVMSLPAAYGASLPSQSETFVAFAAERQRQWQWQRQRTLVRELGSLPRTEASSAAHESDTANQRILTFPSLDPESRVNTSSTSLQELQVERTVVVPESRLNALEMPASANFLGSLTDPWRATAVRPASNQSQIGRTRSSPSTTVSRVLTSQQPTRLSSGSLADMSASVTSSNWPNSAAVHPTQNPAMRTTNDQVSETVYQVLSSDAAYRLQAAEEATRLARQARFRREAMQSRPRAESGPRAAATPRLGLQFLRRLRDLDGLEPNGPTAVTEAGESGSEGNFVLEPHMLLPWHEPPRVARRSSNSITNGSFSRNALAEHNDNPDPDGDAVGTEWYRGVRARNHQAQADEMVQRTQADPNGDRVSTEFSDAESLETTVPAGEFLGAMPPWRIRQRWAHADARSARRQRHRSALVIAEEPEDARPGQRPITDGWMLVTPATPNFRARSPVQGDSSTSTSTWFRGPAQLPLTILASPVSMDTAGTLATEDSLLNGEVVTGAIDREAQDLRRVRRPQRTSSLTTGELRALISELQGQGNGSVNHNAPASFPTVRRRPSPNGSVPVRRADLDDLVNIDQSVAGGEGLQIMSQVVPNMNMDDLRSREARLWRNEISHSSQEPAARSRPATRRGSALSGSSLDSLSRRANWLFNVSRDIEMELRERQDELRAYQVRLNQELAQRRSRIDELRQREGRIGRILSRTQETPRSSMPSGQEGVPAPTENIVTDTEQNSQQSFGSSSLVRRRTLRDSAPSLRAPRSVRMPDWLSPHDSVRSYRFGSVSPENSGSLRPRSNSSGSLFDRRRRNVADQLSESEEKVGIENEGERRLRQHAQDDMALSRAATTSSSWGIMNAMPALGLPNLQLPNLQKCFLREQDRNALGIEGVQVINAIDEHGTQSYFEALTRARRERLLARAPSQPALPTSSGETSLVLRFEALRQQRSEGAEDLSGSDQPHGSTSSGALGNVLKNDESGLRFEAEKGAEVVLRFLAAVPPQSGPATAQVAPSRPPATEYPHLRMDEDEIWSRARLRVIQLRTSGALANGPGRDSRDARRALLGLPPRNAVRAATSGGVRTSDTNSNVPRLVRRPDLRPEEVTLLQQLQPNPAFASSQPAARRMSVLGSPSRDDIRIFHQLIRRWRRSVEGSSDTQMSASPSSPPDESREAGSGSSMPSSQASLTPNDSLASLTVPEAVPLSESEMVSIRRIVADVKSRTGGLVPGDPPKLLPLIGESVVNDLIASRAKAIFNASLRSSSDGCNGCNTDPLGPLFTLHSVIIKAQRSKQTVTSTECYCHANKSSGIAIHGLVFVSYSPLTREMLAEWDNRRPDEVRAIAVRAGLVGPGLHAPNDPDEEEDDEELGDPGAMSRRAGKQRRLDDELSKQLEITAAGEPKILPRALFTLEVGLSSAACTVDFTASATTEQTSRPGLGPCGRYLIVKLLGCEKPDTSVVSAADEGGPSTSMGGSSSSGGATGQSTSYELLYVGVKGWPTLGMSSISGKTREAN